MSLNKRRQVRQYLESTKHESMRRVALAFTVVLLAFLTACASPHSNLLSRKEPLIDEHHGVVVVSLGSATIPEARISATIKQSDGRPANFAFRTRANLLSGAWEGTEAVRAGPAGSKRMLLAYSVSPGSYSVDTVYSSLRYSVMSEKVQTGITLLESSASYTGQVRLPVPFSVEAGKITYLGAVEVNLITGANALGEIIPAFSRQVPSRMSVRLLDEFEEDNSLLMSIRPELKDTPVLRP